MRFENFESFGKIGKGIRKVVGISALMGLSLFANKTEAQVNQEVGHFLDRLKHFHIVDEKMTEEEFAKIPEEDMEGLANKYLKASGAVLPKDAPKDATVIKRVKYGLDETTTIETKIKKPEEKSFYFNEWFADQMAAVRQGKLKKGDSVLAPNGKFYKLEEEKDPVKATKINQVSSITKAEEESGGSEDVITSSETKFKFVEDHFRGK